MWVIIVTVVFLLFGLTVLRGAPYVPTHKRQVEEALDLLDLPAGSRIIDLGSGDGVVLRAAARRGLSAIGYEINPILCVIGWLRCMRYRHLVKNRWRDFWLARVPEEADAVFVFAGGPFMKRLARKLVRDTAYRSRPLKVVSYGFTMPGRKAVVSSNGLHVYMYRP